MSFDLVVLLLRLGVVALLYLFLLQVVLILRRDLAASTSQQAGAAPTRLGARLVVLEAGTSGLAPGQPFPLAEVNSLGRGPGNSVVLADDSVSAQHALLVQRNGQWWLEDRGSTNGTLVAGRRVDEPTPVAPGDVISLGRVRLRLERA